MTYENLDAKLINALLGDGRASLRSLAEDLDVSVTTVSNHLRDLEDEGVIQGYTPRVKGSALPDITDDLQKHKQMVSVYEVTGDYDVIAVAKFIDTDGMDDQIKELLTDADIRESNTSVILNTVAEGRQFDLDVEADEA